MMGCWTATWGAKDEEWPWVSLDDVQHDPWIRCVSPHRKNSLPCLAGHTNMNSLWQGSNESVFVQNYLQRRHCGGHMQTSNGPPTSPRLNVSKSMASRRINDANDGLLKSNLGWYDEEWPWVSLDDAQAWSLNMVCFTTQKEQLTMPSWHTNMNSLWQGSNESVFVRNYLQQHHCGGHLQTSNDPPTSPSLNVSKSMASRRINDANDGLFDSNLGYRRWRMDDGVSQPHKQHTVS